LGLLAQNFVFHQATGFVQSAADLVLVVMIEAVSFAVPVPAAVSRLLRTLYGTAPCCCAL